MSRRGWLLFVVMSVLWGVPYLMIKVAVDGVSVPMVVFTRTAIGGLLLLPFALRGGGLRQVRKHWRPVLAFTALEMIGPWYFLTDAERTLPSSLCGLIIATVPVIGAIAVRATGGTDRLGRKQWAGLAVGLIGVGILVGPNLGGGDAWPTVEVLFTALGYAIAPLIVARYLDDVPGLPLTAVSLSLAAVVYTPAAIVTWPEQWPEPEVLWALAGLALLCTTIAFLVFFALIREVGPARATVFTYVNPAVAVLAGVLVLGEPLTVLIVVAFTLILAGSVLATSRDTPAPGPARAENTAETGVR
ncbi:DMT family transporter [Cryptosporangium aurantiacum]|uniref:Permease of the drug/metabolite transporter (DMT) superfamily n=1 Tax=Cryptosporangium aurantiacum TaxID=134849 RepID=A0A1M7JZ43_9ACTN|nr:EamA family transporter [Cryptosporangium aurantiacum]SHM58268.1 Permease of the drug/metabolite transporter (DMT) superfamily [Cryptosporangium aurantiacum]